MRIRSRLGSVASTRSPIRWRISASMSVSVARGVINVALEIMGPIFIVARLIDAIQDPVIGLLSDRFTRRGPRGRLTFVALMIPVLAGGFYMLFDPPDAWFGDQTRMAIWLIAALLLVHFGYSGVSISYHSH